MIKGEDGWDDYVDRIGLFFFFVACAGVSLIVWAFNWVCWLNQCCCCDFLHNPVNKRIAWWMSFTFLCGMLACCISGCVSVNRFGFAIEGARCAFDRIYYDSYNGQLKTTAPKWQGFKNTSTILDDINSFLVEVKATTSLPTTLSDCSSATHVSRYTYEKIVSSLEELQTFLPSLPTGTTVFTQIQDFKDYLDTNFKNFGTIKTKFLDDGCFYYARVLIACMKVLAMIYFCLFIITITLAGISMMFYACLKRQGYLITFMHVLWNIIRFFMFSFFIFGAAYGIFFLALRDSVAVVNNIFDAGDDGFLNRHSTNLFPPASENQFLIQCLKNTDYNVIDKLEDDKLKVLLEDFFFSYQKLTEILDGDYSSSTDADCISKINDKIEKFDTTTPSTPQTLCDKLKCKDFPKWAVQDGGLFGSFKCGFVQTDLNLIKRALYDASVESRILAACSLCASFFGAVAVYFYLLVLHHYNNELFFDSGKSIFTGFDGFGRGYKTKNHNQDPAYKKRKLRSEIELTSKNDEVSNYKDINKNDDED